MELRNSEERTKKHNKDNEERSSNESKHKVYCLNEFDETREETSQMMNLDGKKKNWITVFKKYRCTR